MYYKLRPRSAPRSNTPGENIPLKFDDQPRRYPSLSPAIVAGATDLIEHRVYDARLIKATTRFLPSPPNPASTPSFTPKMAAQFLEAVRNRRVNIGRSISVFGRGGKRRWHAAGNTGVMQRHTQPQKSRATHPRALRPLRRALPLSLFLLCPSVLRQQVYFARARAPPPFV